MIFMLCMYDILIYQEHGYQTSNQTKEYQNTNILEIRIHKIKNMNIKQKSKNTRINSKHEYRRYQHMNIKQNSKNTRIHSKYEYRR